jgi:DNA polymerase-3 subunit delta'
MLLPWQKFDYKNLLYILERHNPAALLLYGSNPELAQIILKKLYLKALCLGLNETCAQCPSCRLATAGTHPDLFCLTTDEVEERKSPTIKVEQIRELLEFTATAPHQALRKIIYLPDCSQLSLSSANALLKTLEEAPAYCLFIFYGHSLAGVLPTIKSRMFKYKLTAPQRSEALEYLSAQKVEEPLFYLDYFNGEVVLNPPFNSDQIKLLVSSLLYPSIDNLFKLSIEMEPKQLGLNNLLDFLLRWLSDLALLRLGGGVYYFANLAQELQTIVQQLNLPRLYQLVDEIIWLQQWNKHPLNQKLQWENILFKYQQIYCFNGDDK